MAICFSARGDNGLTAVYPVKIDSAILKSVQDKLIKQGHKEMITFSFSQPEILVAITSKAKSYTDAKLTLGFSLMKLISLRKGN